ncbi:hypothetical protein JRO89_XS13G0263100 [Xanthoceras sorbifolium]|uniref:Exocyst subunit Exo70 family protein n=1 Tax=Xanthoceras sorbifolium TaxID=99658 RepID=A0ABQ8HA09_9ROSI|nr:hypothetical protein JRO89_XS13G0263100 [Xanthoceras sorbifolium]
MEEKLQRKGQACTVGFFHKPRNYSRRALLLSIMRFDDIKSQKLFILLLDLKPEGINELKTALRLSPGTSQHDMDLPRNVLSDDEIHKVMQSLGGLSLNENVKVKEFLNRADSILQMAMSRLEEELVHILVQHKQYFEPEYVSFHSCQEDAVYDESFVSLEDETVEETSQRVSSGNVSGEYIVDLVHPRVIPDLKAIADVMFASNYDQEFCEVFIGVRKAALDEYFVILAMEKFSIEDVLKLKWSTLSSEIKKWNWAMKIIIQVYLASEKQLCYKILGEFGSVSSFCFVEIAKASLLCLLNFGEAITMGSIQLEKLFRLLDMYEVLNDLLVDIDDLLFEEVGSYVRIEFHELLRKLGHYARATFFELRSAIVSDTSLKPLPRGGIHPLTRYVMNYIKTLTIYDHTINMLLKDHDMDCSNPVAELENEQEISSVTSCALAFQLQLVTSALECNLVNKSKLYKEDALRHIFLLNNIHYMVQKVKNSDLRHFFGDEWIRKHNGKFQQHATSYQRATWSSVLSFLRVDSPGSCSILKTSPKERCKEFSIAFEEVYKNQTQWCISDPQLQEDLRIANLKVIHAYRTFLGITRISDKHIKYKVDDLEKLLLDFFEGSQRSLRSSHRR